MIDEQEMAESLYGHSPIHGDAARAIERTAIESELATPEEASARAEAWTGVFHDLGLNATESVRLAQLRGNPTPEQRALWQEDSRNALRQDYGDAAGEVLQDVRTYITKHPELRDHLRKTGLGDHPQWMRIVAARAREAKARGRL